MEDSLNIRTVWNEEEKKWYFSIVDVIRVLTESSDPKQYIKKMRSRDQEFNNVWNTICTPTEMIASDGKRYITQAASTEQIIQLLHFIPSAKVETFKQWIDQTADNSIAQTTQRDIIPHQTVVDYSGYGYSESWWTNRNEKSAENKFKKTEGLSNLEILLNSLSEEMATQTGTKTVTDNNPAQD